MSLRRGFKAEANAYAREFREELDLTATDPLCPWQLAEHLCIPVIALSSLKSFAPTEVRYLLRQGREFFSAVTVGSGYRRGILHNDGNAPTRQVADLAHEIAHAVLGHPVLPAFDLDGKRTINHQHEEEAKWLGPALLISEECALAVARSNDPIESAAKRYGVSPALMRMRLNVTGALRRVGAKR